MKEKYLQPDIEIIHFDVEDVVYASDPDDVETPEDPIGK